MPTLNYKYFYTVLLQSDMAGNCHPTLVGRDSIPSRRLSLLPLPKYFRADATVTWLRKEEA